MAIGMTSLLMALVLVVVKFLDQVGYEQSLQENQK
jgi:hypothetical protein